jgi:hypothetical protein
MPQEVGKMIDKMVLKSRKFGNEDFAGLLFLFSYNVE